MGKLMVGLVRFLLLWTLLLALPALAAAQCVSRLSIQSVLTQDAGGNNKTTFAPGEPIHIIAQINNAYGAYMLAANGAQIAVRSSFYNDTKPVNIPPGVSTWPWNATALASQASYTVTVYAYDHFCGVWVAGNASFTVLSPGQSGQFLTLPFPKGDNASTGDSEMNVQQGWYYTGGGLHSGIDYIEGTIDNSNTWQHFPVVAAADGEACGDGPAPQGGCVDFKDGGYRILIKHTVNGQTFYTYYGHVNWIAPWIPMGNRNNTVHVTRGSQIGTSGSTGVVWNGVLQPTWVHLHFGLTPPSFSWLDPYDLNGTREKYPNPNGTNGKRSNPNHRWTSNPPVYAPGLSRNYGGIPNLDIYCKSLGHRGLSLDGNTAYDWHCVTTSGAKVGINMAGACNWQYNTSGLTALTKNFYTPYSWGCYGS